MNFVSVGQKRRKVFENAPKRSRLHVTCGKENSVGENQYNCFFMWYCMIIHFLNVKWHLNLRGNQPCELG